MVKRTQTKEQLLLLRVQQSKDPQAFGALYDLYIEPLYRFVYFKVGSVQDAEELTADVFMKAWDYLSQFGTDTVKSFRPFIYKVARNTIIDWYRKKATTAEIPTELHTLDIPDHTDLVHHIDIQFSFEKIEQALKKLKSEYQEVIILKYIEELSTTEIAEMLGKKKAAVRVLLHRALKKLETIIDTK